MALASPPTHRNAFRIAIICALPLEAEMVQAAFDRNWTNEGYKFYKAGGDTNAYTTGLIGDHNVVLAHMARTGNNTAATTASGLRSTFRRLEMIFLVGICGAAPIHPETGREVILGDCIFSTAVIQYDYGRQFDNIFVRKRGLEENLSRANSETQALTARLKIPQNQAQLTERMAFHLGQLQQAQQFEYPGPAFDMLYPASYPHKHHDIEGTCTKCYQDVDGCSSDCLTLGCDPAHLLRRDRLYDKGPMAKPSPYVHFGRIGSANSTLRSAALRDELAKTDQIVGFEMESAGIWEVLPTVLIKSVCDYADSHKNKDWQPYAAASAAACLKALFEQWETTEPSPTTPMAENQWMADDLMNAKQNTSLQYQPVSTRQPSGHLASQLKEIDNALKTPPYEDPLTHNSSLCLEGTATWIFEKETYQKWLHSDSPSTASFLWLYAGAGTGKTILCTSIVNSLKLDPSLNVFHYFSSAHVGSNTDLSNIARYWVSEMARRDISTYTTNTLTLVETALHQYGVGRTVASADAWKIFGNLVSGLSNCVFVLDGLDEYDRSAREQLLFNLKNQLAGKGVKILITSRDESDIRMELNSGHTNQPGLAFNSLGIIREDTQSDISLLSKSLMTRKLRGKSTAFRLALATTLSDKCDGMFLWIRLTSQNLHAGQTTAMLQRIVDKTPAGLHSVYSDKWHSIMQHPEPEEKLRAIAVLRWCTYAFEPLTVAELAEAIAVNLEDQSDDFDHDELPEDIDEDFVIQGIKGLCSSFVELRSKYSIQPLADRTLHLIHSSVKDFLFAELPGIRIREDLTSLPISTHSTEHLELSKICLRYLCYKNVTSFNPMHQGMASQFYTYAIKKWHLHQAESDTEDREFVQLALRFLALKNKNFVDWTHRVVETGESSQALPFYYAARLGLVSVLREIYSQHPESINSVGGKYGTALQATCARGHEKAFELLLSWNADTGIQAGHWGNALAASVAGGNLEITRKLLFFGMDPDQTALFYAIKNDAAEHVAILLERVANFSIVGGADTLLSLAVKWGSLKVINLLFERGVDINAGNDSDRLLRSAIRSGSREITRLLLEHGANTEAVQAQGRTPLIETIYSGDIAITQLLLENSANPIARTNIGDLPGHLAIRYNKSRAMAKLVLGYSTLNTLDYINDEGRTLLQDAAFIGDTKIFDYLVAQGFDLEQKDKHGNGVVESCCASKEPNLLERILQGCSKSLDFTYKSNVWSPLHWACICGSFETVRHLADTGYKMSSVVTSAPQAAWTPLDVARFFHNPKLILENGELNRSHPWETILDSGLVAFDRSSNSIKAVSHNSLTSSEPDILYNCSSCRAASINTRRHASTS